MKRPKIPCTRCDKRAVGCHSLCKEYKEYSQSEKDYRSNIYYNKNKDWGILENSLKP